MGTRNRKRTRSAHNNFIENPKSLTRKRRPQLWHPQKQELEEEEEEEEENSSNDLDLLSNLPESVLSHVISFLDTRSAIRTSILSKRYKPIWTQVYSLDFKSRDSVGPNQSQVLQILKRRDPVSLTRFRLSLYSNESKDFIYSNVSKYFMRHCVEYAGSHKVQNLRIGACVSVTLPGSLLNSSSLVSLRLKNAVCRSIELPMAVNLPNLKVLHLNYFEFGRKSYNGDLFRGCPSLESLVLHKCLIRPGDELKILDLNCVNLRNLEIKHWRSPWRCFKECLIEVNAPKLVSFRFQGCIARVTFEEVSCLDAAYIDVSDPTRVLICEEERKQITSESCASMLWHLRNVKLLSLSWQTVKVLAAFRDIRIQAPIVFVNLRLIKFTTENMYSEIKIPVQSLRQSVEAVTDNVLILNDSEYCCLHEQNEDQNGETKYEDTRTVAVPANVVLYLLENSPSAEFFHIEIPEESSDESMSKLDFNFCGLCGVS